MAVVEERELRFGLVLYGGVSLAIYMHGATKELHRLVRASALPDEPTAEASATEAAWRELLAARAREQQVRTRVVVDCIAGTSAGGINGVYLAKALAHDLSQDGLRDLWFERGDIGVLLRGPSLLPWRTRIPWVVGTLAWWPALRGDAMAAWLHDALEGMAPIEDGGGGTLMPPEHPLRLFVTVTDHGGYARDIALGDPKVVRERRHRHVLEFRYGDGEDDFGGGGDMDDVALAFAARATSCFPGAFEPVSFASFAKALGTHKRPRLDLDLGPMAERRMFRHYPLAGGQVTQAHLIDGGVLDNRPFRHVIDAIRAAPASLEVERRLLYLEPKPEEPAAADGDGREPGPLATVMASLVGIPRHEPILDDIEAVAEINDRVDQLQDVIRASWEEIAGSVEAALREVADGDALDAEQFAASRQAMHELAAAQTGFGYGTYSRVKISDAVDQWAATVCRLSDFPPDCSQASLVRGVLRLWARDVQLLRDASPTLTEAQRSFLRDFDLGYGERHLRFLIAAASWWYDPDSERGSFPLPAREQLDAVKDRLYELLHELRAAMRGQDLPDELRGRIAAALGEQALAQYLEEGATGAEVLLDEATDALLDIVAAFRSHLVERLEGFAERVHAAVTEATEGWPAEARRRFRLRHLGYPVWDAVLFPLQAVADVGERDRIDVVRLSPLDASLLAPPTGRKLMGTDLGNFGAFFSRRGRENDYLWGRLDTAERLVDILLGPDHPERTGWCVRIFDAILGEEAAELPQAEALIAALREQLAAHAPPAHVG